MATLEENAIRAVRSELLDASFQTLSEHYHRTSQRVRGGNEREDFEAMVQRDAVAYAVVAIATSMNCNIFGGFLRSHFSGKPWKDLDIMMPSKASSHGIMNAIGRLLPRSLGISRRCVRVSALNAHKYGMKSELVVLHGDRHVRCPIDLVVAPNAHAIKNDRMFLPVSLGSCLAYDGDLVKIRDVSSAVKLMNVRDVTESLSNGEDIMLVLQDCNAPAYKEFFWGRIEAMASDGWRFAQLPVGGRLPSKP